MKKHIDLLSFLVFLVVYTLTVWLYIILRVLAGGGLALCFDIAISWLATCITLGAVWSIHHLCTKDKPKSGQDQEEP